MLNNNLYQFPSDVPLAHQQSLQSQERLASLENAGVMDSPDEEAFDRAVRLATTAIGAPVGLVSFVDGERQFFKAQKGLEGWAKDERQTNLTHSFCQYVTTQNRVLAVEDAREHALLRGNGAVAELGVIAYLGVPIHAPDGETLGSFCAIFNDPHVWTEREKQILSDIAAMLEVELTLREETNSKAMLLKEMAHRIGNLFSIVLGMVRMTERNATPVGDFSEAVLGRVEGLRRAHELVKGNNPGVESVDCSNSLHSIVSNLVEPHLHLRHEQMTLSGPTIQAGPKATTNLALIIHELATNAAKYGALSVPEGRVTIEWVENNEEVIMTWCETGGPLINGAPTASGFGSTLIQATSEGPLGGWVSSDWDSSGVTHRLAMSKLRLNY